MSDITGVGRGIGRGAADAAGCTGLVKRSYWVLICVMDANRTKPW